MFFRLVPKGFAVGEGPVSLVLSDWRAAFNHKVGTWGTSGTSVSNATAAAVAARNSQKPRTPKAESRSSDDTLPVVEVGVWVWK